MGPSTVTLLACRLVLCCLAPAAPCFGQDVAIQDAGLADRPVSEVRLDGLRRVSRQLVLNQLRTEVGDPYDPQIVRGDVRRLTRLAEFKFVNATAEVTGEGSVIVVFDFVEMPIISEVQVVGNRVLSDQELQGLIGMRAGDPLDEFRIEQAKRGIEDLYRGRGYYLTAVSIDDAELEESAILIFRIVEGPRVKVKSIEYVGNESFPPEKLSGEIRTSKSFPLFKRGELDEDVLLDDVASLDRFYKGNGYLDVRVDRGIEISPDNKEAKVVFLIVEGEQYTLRSVRVGSQVAGRNVPPRVFAIEQIKALIELKTGDVYSRESLSASVEALQAAYERLGFLDVTVRPFELRAGDAPEVDLLLEIEEGRRYRVGVVNISGNFLTREKVIRRQVRLQPGRPFDGTQIANSERMIGRTRLFNDVRMTVQDPDPDDPEHRDVLVEVKEANTGRVNFGLAFGSDTGAFGDLRLSQSNFDISDMPQSLQELASGRAFRGAGQSFQLILRPGSEIFQFLVSWSEPRIFETDYSFGVSGAYRERQFDDYDEKRKTASISVGRRLGDIWTVGFRGRVEDIELTDIDLDAPTDVYEDAGPNTLTGASLGLTRTTLDNLIRPGKGSRFELTYERVGAFGGDFNYNSLLAEYTVFLTIDEDILGRISTLRLNGKVGYLWDGDTPTYERFYLGDRTFRGFRFREISPKGIRADTGGPSDKGVGGDWMVFLGIQYEFPIYQETFRGVFFVDSGTVTDDIGLDMYRVSVGTGVRVSLPILGQAPLAFDLAWPIVSEDTDDEKVFSFTFELPF